MTTTTILEKQVRKTFNGCDFSIFFRVEKDEDGYFIFNHYVHYGDDYRKVKLHNPNWDDYEQWQQLLEFDAEIYRIARFNYAIVSNRIKIQMVEWLNLQPLTKFDDYLPKREFQINANEVLKVIGYGILETDTNDFAKIQEVGEPFDYLKTIGFPEGFDALYNDFYAENNKLQTFAKHKRAIDALGLGAKIDLPFDEKLAANELKRDQLNLILKQVRREFRLICEARQEKLIEFFFAQLQKYFPNYDPRIDFRK